MVRLVAQVGQPGRRWPFHGRRQSRHRFSPNQEARLGAGEERQPCRSLPAVVRKSLRIPAAAPPPPPWPPSRDAGPPSDCGGSAAAHHRVRVVGDAPRARWSIQSRQPGSCCKHGSVLEAFPVASAVIASAASSMRPASAPSRSTWTTRAVLGIIVALRDPVIIHAGHRSSTTRSGGSARNCNMARSALLPAAHGWSGSAVPGPRTRHRQTLNSSSASSAVSTVRTHPTHRRRSGSPGAWPDSTGRRVARWRPSTVPVPADGPATGWSPDPP